jgi:membrane-associated phospholipid phosphatase
VKIPKTAIWVFAALAAAALATAVLAHYDLELSNRAQALPLSHDDFSFWWLVNSYGEVPTWAVIGLAAAAYLLSFGASAIRRYRPHLLFLILTELSGPGLITTVLKHVISRPRPGDGLGFHPLFVLGSGHDNGFPSGHTASAFALLALAYLVPKSRPVLKAAAAGWFCFWGVAVGAARTIWGAHYPTDALFGALITLAVEWALWVFWFKKRVEKADLSP